MYHKISLLLSYRNMFVSGDNNVFQIRVVINIPFTCISKLLNKTMHVLFENGGVSNNVPTSEW